MSWKSRPRKAAEQLLRVTKPELPKLLLPATSPYPLHFDPDRQYHHLAPSKLPPSSAPHPAPSVPLSDPPADRPSGRSPVRTPPVLKPDSTLNGVGTIIQLGDDYIGRSTVMNHIGLDIGTKTIVLGYEDAQGKASFISEINGYWVFERTTPFVINLLNDGTKTRSDGTQRPAKWIPLGEKILVLGRDAEEFAYAHNDTMRRPMAEGGVTADEESMTVLSSIVQNLLEMADKDVGKFGKEVKLVYSTTATALNKENNVDYHERVVDIIIAGYQTKSKINIQKLRESHAIVLNESGDGTGIGISWGAGTVTVSYAKYGLEVYSFCWIGAGDWIDEQVAMRHGYNPQAHKARGKTAKETPTTVTKRKHIIDLTPGKEPTDRVGVDILLHYQVLISQVVDGIVDGFVENETNARIEDAVPVYMAGGTSIPSGFEQRVVAEFQKRQLPFQLGPVTKADNPLFTVAHGLLKAAKFF